MKQLSENQKKALDKLEKEILNDIQLAVDISKQGYLFDLLYIIYTLKINRLHRVYSEGIGQSTALSKTAFSMYEEVAKYIIQLLVKYFSPQMVLDKENNTPFINHKLIQALVKQCTLINSKYEYQGLVQIFDVEITDKNAKQIKINMHNVTTDKDAEKFFNYFLRVDRDNDIKKNSLKKKDALVENFKNEYEPVNDLFEKAFNLSIYEFCEMILWFLNKSQQKLEKAKAKFEYIEDDIVDDLSIQTMMAIIPSFLVGVEEIKERFDTKYNKILNMLTFDKSVFNENQLRFHLITRSPLLKIHDYYIVSPELILDSLFINIHYSLIESTFVKEEYKAKQSTLFLDKIVTLAKSYGFTEFEREFDLYEGKNQIGDIDLILKDVNDNYILIEAKNHALPLDVYFKDMIKTRIHLNDLKNNWENKVIKRIKHLKNNHLKYSIPKTYQYIVVSKFPEIISHYSDLLILSICEFDYWLKKNRWSTNFDEITNAFYTLHERKFTKKDISELSKAGLILGDFSIE